MSNKNLKKNPKSMKVVKKRVTKRVTTISAIQFGIITKNIEI